MTATLDETPLCGSCGDMRPATTRVEAPNGTIWLLCDHCAWLAVHWSGFRYAEDIDAQYPLQEKRP